MIPLPRCHLFLIGLLAALSTRGQVGNGEKPAAEIRGKAVERESGSAIPGALVQARCGSTVITAKSDAEGRFVLSPVTPGDWDVIAAKDGRAQSRHLTLPKGFGGVSDLDMKIPAASVIAGHVSEADGSPAVNATIELWQRYFRHGAAFYAHNNYATTNQKGDYRLTIDRRGTYCITASRSKPTVKSLRPATRAAHPVDRPPKDVITYYPGTSDPAAMMLIAVYPGQQLEGIDLKLIKTRTSCASAQIQTQSQISILLYQAAPGGSIGPIIVGAVGPFQICDLAPATYRMIAQILPEDFSPPANFAEVSFTIGHEDVNLGELQPTLAITQKGHVKVLGEKAPSVPAGMAIYVEPSGGDHYVGEDTTSVVDSSGEFLLPRLFPRQFLLNVQALPRGYYVKYANIWGRDVMREPFRAGAGDLEIELATDGGYVSGVVVDSDDHPVPDCPVLLTPETLPTSSALTQIDTVFTDQNGQFKFTSVRPGKHLLFAVSGLGFGNEQNPEFLRSPSRTPQTVKVEPSGETTIKLKAELAVD